MPYRTYKGAFAFDPEYSWHEPKSQMDLKRTVVAHASFASSLEYQFEESSLEYQFEEGDYAMFLEHRYVAEDIVACKFIIKDRVESVILLTYDTDFLELAMPEKKDV
jgi:hypothetical protein